MDYIDPLARTHYFHLLEGRERLHLLEKDLGVIAKGRELYDRGQEAYDKVKAAHGKVKAAHGKVKAAHGNAVAAYDQGKQDVKQVKGTFAKVRGLSKKPAAGDPPQRSELKTPALKKKGRFDIVPDAFSYKKDDPWYKTAAKAAIRAPFDGFVATKDLLIGGEAESGLGKVLGWDKNSSFLSRAQDVVDVIGIIDPTGIADASNALAYAAQGKWGDAATSALGIIPYAGDIGKLTKYSARAEKVAAVIGKAAKAEGRLAKAAKVVEKGVAKKAAVHGAEKVAARNAAHAAEKAAAKAVVHGTEKTVVRGAEAASKGGRFAKLKQTYDKVKKLYGHGKEAVRRIDDVASKIQDRRDAYEGGSPEQGQPPARTPLVTPTSEAPVAPGATPDTTADLGRRTSGALFRGTPASLAPSDSGPVDRGGPRPTTSNDVGSVGGGGSSGGVTQLGTPKAPSAVDPGEVDSLRKQGIPVSVNKNGAFRRDKSKQGDKGPLEKEGGQQNASINWDSRLKLLAV